MFETLLKIVPIASSAFQWVLNLNEKKRESFASLCDEISNTLKTYAAATD